MEATYISNNSFSVVGVRTGDFIEGRRLKLDCGVDGTVYASVVSSEFTTVTVVVINETSLTSNLVDVLYSPVKPGTLGNLPDHFHSSAEGDGGYIEPPTFEFTGLTDTPTTYSGAEGLYAMVSGTQIVFAEGSDIKNFVDLLDTPSSYTEGLLLTTSTSGIDSVFQPFYYGAGAPSQALGQDDAIYFDTTNKDVYSKDLQVTTADLFTGGSASSSSSYGGQGPTAPYDNTLGTTLTTFNDSSMWSQYDLGAGNEVRASKLRLYIAYWCQTYDFKASNDGTNWDVILQDVATGATTNSYFWHEQTFPTTQPYRYWRVYVKNSTNSYRIIDEIELNYIYKAWQKNISIADRTDNNFLALDDTPTTYTAGQYLRTTASGIEAIDGIILKSPDSNEWLLSVTNSGTLSITGI